MNATAEKLYQLLPAFYRQRDSEQGSPLKALIHVIAEQAEVVEADIAQLYENWFIETCDEWVVPYIGDLLGVRGVHPISESAYTLRAFVANTLRYRRRKGTATMLEQLARDVTGWNARAVEFFTLLGTTQYINHVRLDNHRTPDLRRVNSLELLDTPFDTIAHTVDVRHISSSRGKHNIPNIGLFLWRLQAFPVYRATAYSHNGGKFSFSALGNDIPLFNHPVTETEITHLAEELNVPGPIRRLAFLEEKASYYDETRSINLWVNEEEIQPDKIIPCNLEDWQHRPPSVPEGMIAVDPVLGRIAFPVGVEPEAGKVEVKYYYGFGSEVGGGCYPRRQPIPDGAYMYEIGKKDAFDTIMEALLQWEADGKKNAVLFVKDSRIYEESINIVIPPGVNLEIRAADKQYPLLHLTAPLSITGKEAAEDQFHAQLTLDGLRLCAEAVIIKDGDLGTLKLRHCTLVPGLHITPEGKPTMPGAVSLAAPAGNTSLKISIERSICGGIELSDTHDLEIRESIIQGGETNAINGSNVTVEASTIVGAVSVRMIELASNTIFTDMVKADLTQRGCVRFCYIPGEARVPRRYRCQPDMAIQQVLEAVSTTQSPLPDTKKRQLEENIRLWLQPVFTAKAYGKPGYVQLSPKCPKEIREGAENGAEMGVFKLLLQPQREANLWTSLDEYLRLGLEAGIFFVT